MMPEGQGAHPAFGGGVGLEDAADDDVIRRAHARFPSMILQAIVRLDPKVGGNVALENSEPTSQENRIGRAAAAGRCDCTDRASTG
jgi:hypothetical protein